jgi:hypothetical protein
VLVKSLTRREPSELAEDYPGQRISGPEDLHPRVGDRCWVRGVACRIVAIRPAGTIDVEALDGSRAWRLSGLDTRRVR